jgi:NAD(P)-dependent dehydrogenase (short-subunit alcohol dehydrogenase family)
MASRQAATLSNMEATVSNQGAVVVVGGTRSIGLEIARHYVHRGETVVLTGRDPGHVAAAVDELGGAATGVTFDLAEPTTIAPALAGIGPVRYVVLVAIDRDQNTVADYDITGAIRLATLKLVGYTEVVHSLLGRLVPGAAIVMFGCQAKDLPYPGSTTVSTVNGGIEGLVRTLVHELKPIRVNCLHPGIVGNSPYWETRPAALAATLARTPTDRLTTMDDIVGGVAFLIENNGVNGVNLKIDGGLHCT